jgi:hypothetical protein
MEIFFKIRRQFRRNQNHFDMLISIAVPYPVHWAVASYWRAKGRNIADYWAADCGDPYCLQENDTFRPPIYFRIVEKWFMRKADAVVVPTESSYKGYFPEFHHKIKVIPQGFRFEDVRRKEQINDGVVRFGYGGTFILNRRDPREFLEFLCSLTKDFRFEFHVYTSHEHFVQPYASKDSRIILHKPIDRISLLEEFSQFNFVVNFSNVGFAQTPSKLIDYAIIDKPVLEIQTNQLDTENVLNFLKGDYSKSVSIKNPEQYRIETVVNKFLDLIKE